MTSERKYVIIVANPKSGSRSRDDLIEILQAQLREHGFAPKLCGDLETLASTIHELHESGRLHAVVAAGGDGTASAVASRSPAEVSIAILPLGTENLLAKFLGLTCDPVQLAKSIAKGSTRRIDCGLANGKLFLVMVGIGFDAHVVLEMSRARTGHIRHWSYTMPIIRSILQYRFPELRITACTTTTSKEESQEQHTWNARWVFVANLPRYAAGLPIAGWAASDDGLLDVCTFRGGGFLRSLGYFAYLFFDRHRTLSAFLTRKARHIRIESQESAGSSVAYQIDGDYGGELPVEIQVLPNRLKLIVTPDECMGE